MKRSHPEIVWGKAVNYKLSAVMDEELCRLASCYSALFILPLRPPLGVQIEARKDEYKLTSCHKITHKHSHSTPNCRALQTGQRHTIERLGGWTLKMHQQQLASVWGERRRKKWRRREESYIREADWKKENRGEMDTERYYELTWEKVKKNTNRT